MSWEAMLEYETRANNPTHAHHEWWTRNGGYGTGKWSEKAFLAGVTWVLERQTEWDGLTEREAILELRRGHDSIFYPLFRDDPKIWGDCPRDGRVTLDESGICDRCLYDFAR